MLYWRTESTDRQKGNDMTEIEKMQRAKMYLDKLADGINPLDGTRLPDGDIVNHVRITRCLHYVSEVLGQVIDKEIIQSQPKIRKIPFAISNEQLAGYTLSEEPIRITEITSRINALIDTNRMQKLSATAITAWLVSEELLYVAVHPDGKTGRYPTENGFRFGITTTQRITPNGEYTAVLYNSYAQMYIIKHLQEIVEKQNEKRL